MLTRYLLLIWLLLPANLAEAARWFRGNTHVHTSRSDGDSTLAVVAKWDYDHNYIFLVVTDQNKLINLKELKPHKNKRKDTILIQDEAISGQKTIHTTAMNINRVVPSQYDHGEKSKIVQNHVSGTVEAGGYAILNHPNYKYAVSAKDILPVKNLYIFEIFNGVFSVNNFGDGAHPSTEEIWDELLSAGMKMYGVASDDAHNFQEFSAKHHNPGRGWVMVQASRLAPDAITKAMARGDFYARNGVFLSICKGSPDAYVIKVDQRRTRKELISSSELRGRGVDKGTVGYRIEFIGPKGKVLARIKGIRGTYRIKKSDTYVRARVTLTRKHPKYGLEEYYAWGNPVFTADRAREDQTP